jgi:tetratricopeptide (TPR) repeat protein
MVFGPYRLLRELGRGGQAVVWLAEDPRIGRRVALKVLPPLGPGSDAVLRRFRREAEVTSRLEHPAICPVYEADVEAGVPFIAMRYVEGETLARRIASARERGLRAVALGDPAATEPDWNALAGFFAKAARALHVAHDAGVVHYDVKPANLMVTPGGEPVILDFGLARQDEPGSHALSMSGSQSGTPTYMSPEQITGRSRPDRRSDVYSLGCTLFECLTARPAFAAATLDGLFHAILSQDAPSARAVHAAVPLDLAVITATAIEKAPERRYKTALDLAQDLERFVRLEPIEARPITRAQRAARWARRNPALAGSLAAVLSLVVVATGLLSYGVGASGRAELETELRRRAEAEQQRLVQATADRELAGRMDELGMKLGTLMFGYQVGRDAVAYLRPAFERVLREAGLDLSVPDAVARGKARVAALRARDPNAARALLDILRRFGALPGIEAAALKNLIPLLAEFQDPHTARISEARSKWEQDHVDTFEPLLAEASLAGLDAEQLADLAGMMTGVDGRGDTLLRLLDRALLLKPDSFAIHFMRAGMCMQRLPPDLAGEQARSFAEQAVEHLQAAVALRPRSGLARGALASAQAVLAVITRDQGAFAQIVSLMQSATDVDPDNEIVWFLRAEFLRRAPQGRKGAIAACRKSLELEPGFLPAKALLETLLK